VWLGLGVAAVCGAAAPEPWFRDDFEAPAPGGLPGAPWKEETYRSGAEVRIDTARAWSGRQSLQVITPPGAPYRRGYVAIHLGGPLPQAQAAMYGRAMVWLESAPTALTGAPPVHWTLLQGEGRSADDRYNSIYRLGLEQDGGTRLMANFETTPPVRTDCRQISTRHLPTGRWACVEWHFVARSQQLEFWLDGRRITRVRGRARAADACAGHDLQDEWRAPPKFDSLYIGLERYADSIDEQRLWIDDVILAGRRIGCPQSRAAP
jgi:hypothetical protein